MRNEGLRAQVGYKRRPGKYGTKPAIVAANRLQQDFNVGAPDTVWVTDITYIRTHEGWLYLAAVIDLYSRKVVGWSMHSRMQTSLALNALLMAVWRRKPMDKVVVHSDQGSQFTSHEWREFLTDHNLEASMIRRGNCYPSRYLLRNYLPGSGQCCGGKLLPSAQDRADQTKDLQNPRRGPSGRVRLYRNIL